LPDWVYILNAFCLFFYQTFDALDGKQARRTLSSSPLGELFDHGCDAISTVLIAVMVGCVLRLGPSYLFYFCVISMLVPFFLSQWEMFFTGDLVLWYINVTEAQFLVMGLNLIPVILGHGFYATPTTILDVNMTYGQMFLIPCGIVGVMASLNSMKNVTLFCLTNGRLIEAYIYTIPLFINLIGFLIWIFNSPELLKTNTYAFCATNGIVIATIVGRLVLARVCQMPYSVFYYNMVPLVFGVMNSFLAEKSKFFIEDKFITLYCAFAVAAYLHFAISIIIELTDYLGIRCFHIIPKGDLVITKDNVENSPAGTIKVDKIIRN